MRGICSIDPNDVEHKDIILKCKTKVEDAKESCNATQKSVSPGMHTGNCCSKNRKIKASEAKTRFSCITEALESTRQRIESVTKRIHEEHIAGKGQNSVLHYNLVHRFSGAASNEQSRCKGSTGQGMFKRERIPAWDVRKVKSKKEVTKEAQKNSNKVHFASLMDLCHLKNSELEPQFQKYKGRVVFRGDIVKDDSGAYSVFTEQGSSASQVTAAKVMDIISRLPGCAGQAADAVSAYTQ